MKIVSQPKIALVHDDLVQWGGAERVLEALSEIFPEAPIYTSLYDKDSRILQEKFASKKIITSFIQKIPGWKSFYKLLLPLYPIAFEQFDFSEFEVVISQTTRFAKSIITKPRTFHICYCHTPPRFLWNFSGEKIWEILTPYLNFLRNYDQITSHRVDKWVAGSSNAQKRIQKIYKVDSTLIYPFVDFKRFANTQIFNGEYFLTISRLNAYKRVNLAIEAANKLKIPLKIIGIGPEEESLKILAGPTVEFLGLVDEEMLVLLLAGCKALIISAEEDFGLTSLEAQVLGKPVIAYKKGGALETVIPGKTGYFFKSQTKESLISTLVNLDKKGYNQKRCLEQARIFSKENFVKNFKDLVAFL